jgi:predicted alpha/beta-hydrolase family hydrolase
MEHKTLDWIAELIRKNGARIVRFNFLYRAQGKSMPDRMPVLIETYRAVIGSVRDRLAPEALVIGGHSMGGRVASMLEAEASDADGLLLFGYPLHPAGQPDKLRDAHLGAIRIPALQINGTEDELCTQELMDPIAAGLDSWKLEWVPGADHSYAVRKASGRTRTDVEVQMFNALKGWLASL